MIGFSGLTHLGIVSALATASKGFQVLGYDADAARVAAIKAGQLPVAEPGLDDLFASNGDRFSVTSDPSELSRCDIVYISTDVPTDDQGGSDLSGIVRSIDEACRVLLDDALLVVLCQVPPGFTRKIKRAPDRLIYQVETLVFGRAVERACQPERFIVGVADPTRPLPQAYAQLLAAFECPILPMRYESAELTKIAINVCLAASVTVANTMAELAERIGADWSEIVPALKLDRRIGPYSYLAPGLGIAGGNIERDLTTVLSYAQLVGSEASVIAAYLRNSRHARDWALRQLHRLVLSLVADPVVAVLGLAYKENTHSTKNSPSLSLLRAIPDYAVRLYDPLVPHEAAEHGRSTGCGSAIEAATGADVIVVMTPWPEFRAVDADQIRAALRGGVVIDPYAAMPQLNLPGITYLRIGAPHA